ncbi:MAG TPA: MFS transporter, partial [Desulfobacterales bacterium]|nr:MFS transporter [Desulfobacterales bacterium]
ISYLHTINFWAMVAITFFYGIFYAPIIPFLEAFTMDILNENKNIYGRIRAWGSISFILVVLLVGKMMDVYSIRLILVGIFVGSCVQAILSTGIPKISIPRKEPFVAKKKALFNTRVVVFLFCGFLMLFSHGTYYGFYSIHLENLGYGNTFIGIAWAMASIAEILVMINSDRIFKQFSLENVLAFSFLVAAIRWFALFYVTSPVAILLLQIFHSVTYGTFHMASILYMDLLTPEKAKTLGQALNNALTYGLGMMVGFLINGYLYESMGSSALFMMSCLIALAGGGLLKGFQIFNCRLGEGLHAKIENRIDGNS